MNFIIKGTYLALRVLDRMLTVNTFVIITKINPR